MAVILKGGAVFLHIPKTGGSFITRVLKELGLVSVKRGHKHTDIAHLHLPIGTDIIRRARYRVGYMAGLYPDNPFMFCFVRHPLKWYESWYRFMSDPRQNWCDWGSERDWKNWHPNAILNGTGDSDFNQCVRNIINKRPGYVSEMYNDYTNPAIDFVGKQENLREDLIAVLNQLELEFDEKVIREYPLVNKSETDQSIIQWDPELKQKVLELESVGMKIYGYSADEL